MIHDRTILIAEGDRTLRELLCRRLLTLDVVVEEAEDGREAIQILEERHPAIVVVDLALPLMDGYAVIDRVRGLPRSERPMVLVTAERGVVHTLDVDLVQVVLRKPFDVRQVADVIASCLTALRSRRKPAVSAGDQKEGRDPALLR